TGPYAPRRKRVEAALGLVTGLSRLAALACMLYASVWRLPPSPHCGMAASARRYARFLSRAEFPFACLVGAALTLALVMVGVGVAAGLHARTGQRVWRSTLVALATRFLLVLLVLSNWDLGFFTSGPVYFLPSLVLTLMCIVIAILPAGRSAPG